MSCIMVGIRDRHDTLCDRQPVQKDSSHEIIHGGLDLLQSSISTAVACDVLGRGSVMVTCLALTSVSSCRTPHVKLPRFEFSQSETP